MIENRKAWTDLLLSPRIEGGYVNDPDDDGGPTNIGITAATLGEWRKLGRPATVEEVKGITRQEAEGIALARYWNAMRCDQLPGGVDIYAADFAFNSGPGNATPVLQGIVGTDVDGFVGDKTVAACRQMDPMKLLESYHRSRMAFLRGLKNWPKFGDGWTSRCEQMLEIAKSRIVKRPMLNEVASSWTVRWAGLAAVFSAVNVQDIVNALGPLISGLPEALHSAEPITKGIQSVPQGASGDLQSYIVAVFALLAAFQRGRDWWRGKTVK